MTFTSKFRIALFAVTAALTTFPGAGRSQSLEIHTVALSGDSAPEAPAGCEFSTFPDASLNDASEVLVMAVLDGPTGCDIQGLWSGPLSGLQLVALDAQQAPETTLGTTFVGPGGLPAIPNNNVINALGEVAFVSQIAGPGVTITNNFGLWAGRPGNLRLIVRTDDLAPGLDSGAVFFGFVKDIFARTTPSHNREGRVAFHGSALDGGFRRGLWVGSSSGDLALVAGQGEPAPDTEIGSVFSVVDTRFLVLNDANQVAFRGELSGPSIGASNAEGFWVGSAGGVHLLARSGDQAIGWPSGVTYEFLRSRIALNRNGEALFAGQVTGGGVGAFDDTGLWAGFSGSLRSVARAGDPAPGTSEVFKDFNLAAINQAGMLAFQAGVGPPSIGSVRPAIWVEESGTKTLVALNGNQPPGLPAGWMFFLSLTESLALNATGDLAFITEVATPTFSTRDSLWKRNHDGALQLIVLQGDLLDVGGGDLREVSSLAPMSGSTESAGRSQFNNRGEILFVATFTDGSSGIFLASPPVLTAHKDSFIDADRRNVNEGANPKLMVQGAEEGARRAVVAFDSGPIDNFINGPGLASAKLVLTISGRPDDWDDHRRVNAYPLLEEFTEGNGQRLGMPWRERTRGDGEGVTWNCATDTDISNRYRDCDQRWRGGDYGLATADPVRHRDRMRGEVMWDVTDDVLSGYTSWLIKPTSREAEGRVSYYSKEGAADEGNPDLAPRLILE